MLMVLPELKVHAKSTPRSVIRGAGLPLAVKFPLSVADVPILNIALSVIVRASPALVIIVLTARSSPASSVKLFVISHIYSVNGAPPFIAQEPPENVTVRVPGTNVDWLFVHVFFMV